MASVFVSPTPAHPPVMSGRRVPLSTNQNVANSPLRNSGLLAKHKRPLAQVQREEQYGQPPPAKKQVIESGSQRLLKSPSQLRVSKSQIPIQVRRNANSYENKITKERSTHSQHTRPSQSVSVAADHTQKDIEEIQAWQQHHRARFPKLVFYFEKVPDDAHRKLAKQIAALGGREEAFFSINITHVITTRSIPSERAVSRRDDDAAVEIHADDIQEHEQEEVRTINPSLLTRLTEASTKRRAFDKDIRAQKAASHGQADALSQPKRNMDVLLRAREMGKKIWSLEKLQRMTALLLETDPYVSVEMAYGARRTREQESRTAKDGNLLHLLHNERVNGPSDRDPTVNAQELHYFKGPYIYIYDVEEKQKPIMVREYKKVADKAKGAWPQFRTSPLGRCPFIDEYEPREVQPQPKPKVQVTRAAAERKPILQPPTMEPPKPVTGKRSLGEMENSHSRGSSVASIDLSTSYKLPLGQIPEGRSNSFIGRSTSRLIGGEPVASGVQPSNVTSAIRSQMVSSTATTPGVITGLSKEVHGLQRQVLKRNSTATSQDLSSRRNAETSLRDDVPIKRSLTLSRTSSRRPELNDENVMNKDSQGTSKAVSRPHKRDTAPAKKSELKPGYCENCAEKYADFDEHIVSKKHRKFADDEVNWLDLDDLLSQLERVPKGNAFSSWAPSRRQHPNACYPPTFASST
ncbi:Dfp1/Him1, central region-domain-containing protein [Hypomontagnella monticulosa]|nr:Dfp1/Him1, central region-domain-containing protein [Hypomontagnella monticulosa]